MAERRLDTYVQIEDDVEIKVNDEGLGLQEREIDEEKSKGKKIRLGRHPDSYRKYKYCPVKGCPCKQPLKTPII